MSSTHSRGRVAVAVAATLLAGSGTAWATRPQATAAPSLAGRVAPPGQTLLTAPGDPDRPLLRSLSPGTSPPDGSKPAPGGTGGEVAIPVPPTGIAIARIGVRMPVRAVGVASDGQMALPPNPADAGWYRYSPPPGGSAGATVLAAHTDAPGYGIGPLARLGELRRGDVLTVLSGGTSRRYLVSSTRQLEKTSLDLAAIFARTGPPRLHLITCGGDFDRTKRHYAQNVVVLAFPAP